MFRYVCFGTLGPATKEGPAYIFHVRGGQDTTVAIDGAMAWCADNLAHQAGEPIRWMRASYNIVVYGETDATAFRLRWC